MITIPSWLFYAVVLVAGIGLYSLLATAWVCWRLWRTRRPGGVVPRIAAAEPSDPWARYTERAKRPAFPGLN